MIPVAKVALRDGTKFRFLNAPRVFAENGVIVIHHSPGPNPEIHNVVFPLDVVHVVEQVFE